MGNYNIDTEMVRLARLRVKCPAPGCPSLVRIKGEFCEKCTREQLQFRIALRLKRRVVA